MLLAMGWIGPGPTIWVGMHLRGAVGIPLIAKGGHSVVPDVDGLPDRRRCQSALEMAASPFNRNVGANVGKTVVLAVRGGLSGLQLYYPNGP